MEVTGAIVSYHPLIRAEVNLLLTSQRPLDGQDLAAVTGAAAVILPQLCRPDLYQLVTKLGRAHFPRAEVQLSLDGKVGNHRLFKNLGLPHPPTLSFTGLEEAVNAWEQGQIQKAGLTPPLVAKGAGGGEGQNVFLVNTPAELKALQNRLTTKCRNGPEGLVLQSYLECGGRDARVVYVGNWQDAFWRVGPPGEFRSNLGQGGRVERHSHSSELKSTLELARRLRRAANLDVAAVDLLVPRDGKPLLLEINFYFGRQALGGSRAFLECYLQAVKDWLGGLGLDTERVSLDREAL